jgi:hypothetical protein
MSSMLIGKKNISAVSAIAPRLEPRNASRWYRQPNINRVEATSAPPRLLRPFLWSLEVGPDGDLGRTLRRLAANGVAGARGALRGGLDAARLRRLRGRRPFAGFRFARVHVGGFHVAGRSRDVRIGLAAGSQVALEERSLARPVEAGLGISGCSCHAHRVGGPEDRPPDRRW